MKRHMVMGALLLLAGCKEPTFAPSGAQAVDGATGPTAEPAGPGQDNDGATRPVSEGGTPSMNGPDASAEQDAGPNPTADSGLDSGAADDAGTARDAGTDASTPERDSGSTPMDSSMPEPCGNNRLDDGEQCDDGDRDDDDGCDSQCRVEDGWSCDAQGCTQLQCSGALQFADANLRAALERAFNLQPGAEISAATAAGWTEFRDDGAALDQADKVVSLVGLECLTGLTFIELDNHAISDLAPLSALDQLTTLWMAYNTITDLTPLSGLTKLEDLLVNDNQLSDLSPLAALTALGRLRVGCTSVSCASTASDISPLSGLTELYELHLRRLPIETLAPLSSLSKLRVLWIDATLFEDFSPLASTDTLEVLMFGNTPVNDLRPLAGLSSLTRVGMTNVSYRCSSQPVIDAWNSAAVVLDAGVTPCLRDCLVDCTSSNPEDCCQCADAPPACATGCDATSLISERRNLSTNFLTLWADGTVHDQPNIARPSIRIGGPVEILLDHYSGINAHDQALTTQYRVDGNGCCSGGYTYHPVVLSQSGQGYDRNHNSQGFWRFDLDDGTSLVEVQTPHSRSLHLTSDEQYGWTTGAGVVSLADLSPWGVVDSLLVDDTGGVPPDVPPGAVTADGAFIAAVPNTGELLRIDQDVEAAWTSSVVVTGQPVISAGGHVIVATADGARVRAFEVATGDEAWAWWDGGAIDDVLVGVDDSGDEIVWAISAASETVYGLAESSGALLYQYTNLSPGTELLLRDCSLHIAGNGELVTLPVPSPGYAPDAPWPVRFHDNQRTASGATPLTH